MIHRRSKQNRIFQDWNGTRGKDNKPIIQSVRYRKYLIRSAMHGNKTGIVSEVGLY